jgi:Flp pilus assembly protein TadD
MTVQEQKAFESRRNTCKNIVEQLQAQAETFGYTEEQILAKGAVPEDVARIHAKLGYFLREIGDNLRAKFAFRQALTLDPKNTWAQNGLKTLLSPQ